MFQVSNWVPLLTIAIKSDTCEVDHELISKRCTRAALLILASSIACAIYLTKVASFSYRSVAKITTLDLVIPLSLTLVAWRMDKTKANHQVDAMAVIQYQSYIIPPFEATKRIFANPDLLSKLTESEINKINNQGRTILDELLEYMESDSLDVFNISLKERLIEKVPNNSKEFFTKLIKSKKLTSYLVQTALQKGKIDANSFTPAEQRDLWIEANDGVIPVLHERNFDLNAIGEDGLTALGKVAESPGAINKNPEELKDWRDLMNELGATGKHPSGG